MNIKMILEPVYRAHNSPFFTMNIIHTSHLSHQPHQIKLNQLTFLPVIVDIQTMNNTSNPDIWSGPLTPQWPPHNPEAVTPPAGGPEGLWHDQGLSPNTMDVDDASNTSATSAERSDPGLRARQAFDARYPELGFEQM